MQREHDESREFWVFCGVMVLILPILFIFTFASASDNTDLPPRPVTATPTLRPTIAPPSNPTATAVPPSAPTATPVPDPDDGSVNSRENVSGGFIQLLVNDAAVGMWTEIQWLAGDGNWYTVDGWRGHTMADRGVYWYVSEAHLGATAWFRWQVFDSEGGVLLVTSDAFKLPGAAMETVAISVTVP